MSSPLLVYGSYGYTGDLVVDEARARGLEPVLGGRDGEALADQAAATGLPTRTFGLDDESSVREALDGVDAVLNCAGPFEATFDPLARAAVATGTDYLDITGELDVFRRARTIDARAEEAGVAVVPGVGYDVVPSDCLAAWLADDVDGPSELTVVVEAPSAPSGGTAETAAANLRAPDLVRRDGALTEALPGSAERRFTVTGRDRATVRLPLGDLVTAHHALGVGEIETYAAMPPAMARAVRHGRPLLRALPEGPAEAVARRIARAVAEGPDADARATDRSWAWAEVRGDDAVARGIVRTPETYRFTALAAVRCAERALAGDAPAGYQSPASAFGADLLDAIPDVALERLE